MTQARYVRDLVLRDNPGLDVEIEEIVTSGDRILDSPLSKIGDRGLFVKEIEQALIDEEIDIAVHSAKDVPTMIPGGLDLVAFPVREDPADVFVGPLGALEELDDDGRVVATSSLRRRSQLLALFPGIDVVDIRGNVETRIRKIGEQGLDGTILAAAGLRRLGREGEAAFRFPPEVMVGAVGQGSLAIEARAGDRRVASIVSGFDHAPTRTAVLAERALMRRLEGGCQVPIGGYARIEDGLLRLTAYVGTLDGDESLRREKSGSPDNPEELGLSLAEEMIGEGANRILAAVRAAAEQDGQ